MGETIFYSNGVFTGVYHTCLDVRKYFINIIFVASSALLLLSACGGGDGGAAVDDGGRSLPQLGESPTDDIDLDGWENELDLDDDGNFLIEIYTAADLNNIRNYLTDGLDSNTSIRNCGSREKSLPCLGYELMANISLAEYENWIPIGYWNNSYADSWHFDMIFEGNGYTISDLQINLTAGNYSDILPAEVSASSAGVGLFAMAGRNSTFANLGIMNFDIQANDLNRVGALVGVIINGEIPSHYQAENIWISNIFISGRSYIGGLIGYYYDGRLKSLRNEKTRVMGTSSRVGGFVGSGYDSVIVNATLQDVNISGRSEVGGVLGYSDEVDVHNAIVSHTFMTAESDKVGMISGYDISSSLSNSRSFLNYASGEDYIGGLYGRAGGSSIVNSSSYNNSFYVADQGAGGLIGYATSSGGMISGSYSADNILHAKHNVGGLAGYSHNLQIERSYVLGGFFNASYQLGGLIGYSSSNSVRDVYVLGPILNIYERSRVDAPVGGMFGVIIESQSNPSSVLSSYVSLGGLSYSLTSNTEVLYGGILGGDPGNAVLSGALWERDIPVTGSGGSFRQTNLLVGFGLSGLMLRELDDEDYMYQDWVESLCEDGSKAWDFGTDSDYPVLTCPSVFPH